MQKIFIFFLFVSSSTYGQSLTFKTLGIDDRIRNYTIKIPDNLKEPNTCSPDSYVYKSADILHYVEDYSLEFSDVTVTADDVNKYGDIAFNNLKNNKKYIFITSGRQLYELKKLLKILEKARKKPSGIEYKIHLIKSSAINAFTVGGHIIITTAIIKKAKSLSTVAAIIGHEIGHNEKEHLHKTIKKIKIINKHIGEDVGEWGILLEKLLFPGFNQPNEIESDLYGIDLCYAAGFNPKAVVLFWKEMSKNEHQDQLESYSNSHPYSENRMKCINKYIRINYSY